MKSHRGSKRNSEMRGGKHEMLPTAAHIGTSQHFFFSYFSDNYGENDMRKIFLRW